MYNSKNNKGKSLKKYYMFFLTYAICIGGYVPFVTLYLRNMGIGSVSISYIVMIVPASAIVFQPLLGQLADRIHRVKALVIAMMVVILASIALLNIRLPIWIVTVVMCTIAIVNGAIYSISVAMLQKKLKDIGEESKYSKVRILYTLGYGVASIWLILTGNNLQIGFYISSLFCLISIMIFMGIEYGSVRRSREKSSITHIFRYGRLVVFLVIGFAICISNSLTIVFLPILYSDIGISDRVFAISTLLMIFSEVPIMLLFNRIYKKVRADRLILLPILAVLCRSVLLSASTNHTMVVLSSVFNGLGFIVVQLVLSIYAREVVRDEELATIQSIITSVVFSGSRVVSAIAVNILIRNNSIREIQKYNVVFLMTATIIYIFIISCKNNKYQSEINTSITL